MSKGRPRSGLGANAFFKPPAAGAGEDAPEQQGEAAPADPPPAQSLPAAQPEASPEDDRVKTTIILPASTVALLDALKINARKTRRKATYSDILDEAIRELARQRGVSA